MALTVRLPGMDFDTPDFSASMHYSAKTAADLKQVVDHLLTMDRDQLSKVPYQVIARCQMANSRNDYPAELRRLREHLNAMFADDIQRHVDAWKLAYVTDPSCDTATLVESLRREHGFVVVTTWSNLTSDLLSDESRERLKWVHARLSTLVMDAVSDVRER